MAFPERLCSSRACSLVPYKPAFAAALDWRDALGALAPAAELIPHADTALDVAVPVYGLEVWA